MGWTLGVSSGVSIALTFVRQPCSGILSPAALLMAHGSHGVVLILGSHMGRCDGQGFCVACAVQSYALRSVTDWPAGDCRQQSELEELQLKGPLLTCPQQ